MVQQKSGQTIRETSHKRFRDVYFNRRIPFV
jgi:hypothetical protein